MSSFDQLDVAMLGRLTDNARLGIAELASELGVSRATIQSRLQRLQDSGILRGFRPIIDLASVGMPLQATVSLEIDQRLLSRIVAGLTALPEVLEITIQAGREDLVVHVAMGSLEGLQVLTASIVAIEGVRKTTSTFAVSTPLPFRVQPLLESLTASAGWGRSTPAPD